MKKVLLFLIFVLAATSFAAKAPTHRSIRAEAMGNAHVALVDDKEAIYFNYAGLTQINRLGNYNLRPEQGYYPRNRGDMRLNFGGAGPFQTYFSTYNVAKDLQDIYNNARDVANAKGLSPSNVLMDSLAAHPELVHTINSYDHKNLSMKIKMDAELAFHNFGGAFWVDGTIAPYLDAGLFLPQIAIDTFYVDAVAQAGGAYEIIDGLSVGGGLKIAKRHKVDIITVGISSYKNLQDSLEDRYHDVSDELFDLDAISFGMDLGVLYQLTREVRLGTSLRDIYFKSLAGDKFTPNWTLGVNYSPRFFNKNTAFSRKFNIAFDYADALNAGDRNYKTFSHINFGMEVEQTLLAWPSYSNIFRALAVRLSGGFKGGYPAAGFAVEALQFFTVEFATWAEELGYYTGQDEERIYMGQLSIGF